MVLHKQKIVEREQGRPTGNSGWKNNLSGDLRIPKLIGKVTQDGDITLLTSGKRKHPRAEGDLDCLKLYPGGLDLLEGWLVIHPKGSEVVTPSPCADCCSWQLLQNEEVDSAQETRWGVQGPSRSRCSSCLFPWPLWQTESSGWCVMGGGKVRS